MVTFESKRLSVHKKPLRIRIKRINISLCHSSIEVRTKSLSHGMLLNFLLNPMDGENFLDERVHIINICRYYRNA